MGNAARAFNAEREQHHAAPEQLELGQGHVDTDHLVPWLEGKPIPDPAAARRGVRRFYESAASAGLTPAEVDVMKTMIAACDRDSGRVEKTVAWIEKASGRNRSTVRKALGGTGYASECDRFGNPLPDAVQEGSLGPLFEVQWLSPRNARYWLPKGHRHRQKGIRIHRLRFTTIEEVLGFARRRKSKRRRVRVEAAKRAATERLLNLKHSAPSAPPPEQVEHSRTRIPGRRSLSDPSRNTDPVAPAFSDPPEPKQDDRAYGASRPPAGSCALPAPNEAPSPSPATVAERHEAERARDVPRAPPAMPPDVATKLAAIADTFVRELAANGRKIPRDPAILATIASRYRLGIDLAELEACAYGAASNPRVLRGAWCPWAFAFSDRVAIAANAHRGRAAMDAAIADALRREAAKAAAALERDADARDLAAFLGVAEREAPIVVAPVAVAIAEHRGEPPPAPKSRDEQLAELEAFQDAYDRELADITRGES